VPGHSIRTAAAAAAAAAAAIGRGVRTSTASASSELGPEEEEQGHSPKSEEEDSVRVPCRPILSTPSIETPCHEWCVVGGRLFSITNARQSKRKKK